MEKNLEVKGVKKVLKEAEVEKKMESLASDLEPVVSDSKVEVLGPQGEITQVSTEPVSVEEEKENLEPTVKAPDPENPEEAKAFTSDEERTAAIAESFNNIFKILKSKNLSEELGDAAAEPVATSDTAPKAISPEVTKDEVHPGEQAAEEVKEVVVESEELGSAAAEPVHDGSEAKEHTPEVTNKDILVGQHAEEVKEVIVEAGDPAYQAKFKALLAKHGVKSPAELKGEKKAAFFKQVDAMHVSKEEKKKNLKEDEEKVEIEVEDGKVEVEVPAEEKAVEAAPEAVEVAVTAEPVVKVSDEAIHIEIPATPAEEAPVASEKEAEALKEAFRTVYSILKHKSLLEEETVEVPADAEAEVKVEEDKIIVHIPTAEAPESKVSSEEAAELKEAVKFIGRFFTSRRLSEQESPVMNHLEKKPATISKEADVHSPELTNADILKGQHAEDVKEVIVEAEEVESPAVPAAAEEPVVPSEEKLPEEKPAEEAPEAVEVAADVEPVVKVTDDAIHVEIPAVPTAEAPAPSAEEVEELKEAFRTVFSILKHKPLLEEESAEGTVEVPADAEAEVKVEDDKIVVHIPTVEAPEATVTPAEGEELKEAVKKIGKILSTRSLKEFDESPVMNHLKKSPATISKEAEVHSPELTNKDILKGQHSEEVKEVIVESELGSAAAEPVHDGSEAKEHTPEVTNKDILVGQHAEEVKEVIVEAEEVEQKHKERKSHTKSDDVVSINFSNSDRLQGKYSADVEPALMESEGGPISGADVTKAEAEAVKPVEVLDAKGDVVKVASVAHTEVKGGEIKVADHDAASKEGAAVRDALHETHHKDESEPRTAEEVSKGTHPVHAEVKDGEIVVQSHDLADKEGVQVRNALQEEVALLETLIFESISAENISESFNLMLEGKFDSFEPEEVAQKKLGKHSVGWRTFWGWFFLGLPGAILFYFLTKKHNENLKNSSAYNSALEMMKSDSKLSAITNKIKSELALPKPDKSILKDLKKQFSERFTEVRKEMQSKSDAKKEKDKKLVLATESVELGSAAAEPVATSDSAPKEHTPEVTNKDILVGQHAEEVKEVIVETEYRSLKDLFLLEGNYFETESVRKVSPEAKLSRLEEQLALLIARDQEDALYEELLRTTIVAKSLQEQVVSKYKKAAKEKAKSIVEMKSKKKAAPKAPVKEAPKAVEVKAAPKAKK